MNRKYLLVSLALFLFASSASAQAPAVNDTIKITILNNEHQPGVIDSNFVARILATNDTAWVGASLGFTWGTKPEDSINWTVDSVVLGPGLALWDFAQVKLVTASAMLLVGGADLFANNPFGPGIDMVVADVYFSLRPGNNFTAGSEMTIDSIFVPPAGPWRVNLVVVDSGLDSRIPNFAGAQKVTFNNIEEVTNAPLPTTFSLSQNYPNPFNPETKFEFTLPVRSEVSITIYNVLGRKVKTLYEGVREAKKYVVTWNGDDENGRQVASGVYFYKMKAGDFVQSRKMMLLK